MFFFLWNPPSVCREQRRKSVICHWEKNRQEFHKPHISVKAIKRKSKTNMTSEKCHFAVSSCERILFLCMWFDKHSILPWPGSQGNMADEKTCFSIKSKLWTKENQEHVKALALQASQFKTSISKDLAHALLLSSFPAAEWKPLFNQGLKCFHKSTKSSEKLIHRVIMFPSSGVKT